MLREARERLKTFSKTEKAVLQIDRLLGDATAAPVAVPIVPGEAWSDLALVDLEAADADARAAWNNLLAHAATATASKPSGAWLKAAHKLCAPVGSTGFVRYFERWLGAVGQPGRQPPRPNPYLDEAAIRTLLCDNNAILLKGLAWASAVVDDPAVPVVLGCCAEVCYKKIPNFGCRCVKLGNACVQALFDHRHAGRRITDRGA